MKPWTAVEKLILCLQETKTIHQELIELLATEKEIYIRAQVQELEKLNHDKELYLQKIKLAEQLRFKIMEEVSTELSLIKVPQNISELLTRLPEEQKQKVWNLKIELESLIQTLSDTNKDNSIYANSALKTLNGAMDQVKESISGKKTYKKKGNFKEGPDQAGNFMSKEA